MRMTAYYKKLEIILSLKKCLSKDTKFKLIMLFISDCISNCYTQYVFRSLPSSTVSPGKSAASIHGHQSSRVSSPVNSRLHSSLWAHLECHLRLVEWKQSIFFTMLFIFIPLTSANVTLAYYLRNNRTYIRYSDLHVISTGPEP